MLDATWLPCCCAAGALQIADNHGNGMGIRTAASCGQLGRAGRSDARKRSGRGERADLGLNVTFDLC